MRTKPAALAVVALLLLGSWPYGQGAAETLSKTVPETGEAGAKAADVRTDLLQRREDSEYWADYYAHVYGVPVELVDAIIDQESGWNPHAVSRKGAAGLMQLMPETATRFGVRNRFRAEENIRGGVAYLAWLSQKFNGDPRLIAAAYHAGEHQISSRALENSSPGVRAYVKHIAQKYHARCRGRAPAMHGKSHIFSPLVVAKKDDAAAHDGDAREPDAASQPADTGLSSLLARNLHTLFASF